MDSPTEEEKPCTTEDKTQRTKRISEVLCTPESQVKKTKRISKRSPVLKNTIDTWAAQCKECCKWRVIPTQEEYEEIRRKFTEDPFTCNKKHNVSCDDPSDLEYGGERIWVIDKPNIPKTPIGFQRGLVLRKDYSKMDCYYVTPNGKKLRASTEVAAFLGEHPEYKDVSEADFSFSTPRIMADTLPQNVAGKKGSSGQVD
ncbi:methyl-CpG-binding domain-containing protein 4-like [Sesamum indicum]|uniref:Methyl-CpG-binding domain-containing protein 4-like n=1 Tax=Sesamum indicum TaxID=4182 RepID=A0A6I9T8W9_SESIN|nr:methyl-CpG-binding domain-containing protein 4-like [Sesamum indicum]